MIYRGGLVFRYECYFDDPLLFIHTSYSKKRFVQFYYDNTVDVHYKEQVDNVISAVIHNNHW